MHILLKNITIAIGFIVTVVVWNAEIVLSDTDKYIPASQSTIEHYKFRRLKMIQKKNVLSIIIRAHNWR